ncbi:MAG: efflux RND transporter permease subunit [Flavobacteriales bacterium]|nr:efflux RND transporter permease subunit [Flavobacteriales bacterium]
MSLPKLAINRPVLAVVMNLILVLFGAIGYTFLGVREFPSVDPPVITVRTNYTGANADIIESQITEPLEKAINGIAGIKSISSSSNQGNSSITVEFELGVDLEAAANDVRDKVSQAVRNLPQDIDAPPVVSKADANSDAILSMLVQSDTRTQLEITDYATNVLQERLQTIPGVSSLQIWGEKRYAMRLWLDPGKMTGLNVSLVEVNEALQRENVELPSGKISGYTNELTLRTFGKMETEEDFNNLIIRSTDEGVVRLKDVGYAVLGPENPETILKESGTPMIGLAIIPLPGANYVEISDEFYKRYEQLQKEVPEDIKLSIGLDSTEFIKKSILEVKETLIIAFILVVLIIFLFFRDWLIALRPLIDIPISLVATFFIMYISGFTINVLTLLGIVLATGLVVDDGIVVTENIFKKLESGLKPKEAAIKGSEEIVFAVISTSITLAVVFLPIIFLQGFVGRLFREFGIVVAGAVLISSFVSLTITPVLSVKMSRNNDKKSRFYTATEPFFEGMINGYKRILSAFMRVRGLAILMIILCFGMIVYFFKLLPTELAPLEDRSNFRLSLTAPEGTSFEAMDDFVGEVSRFVVDSVPEADVVISVTAPGFIGSGSPNTGFVRARLISPSDRVRSQQDVVDAINRNMGKFSQGRVFTIQEQTISSGGRFAGLPVQFVLQNNDFEKIREFMPKFLEAASKDPVFNITDVNLKFNKPELLIRPDREKAANLGVSVADINRTLQLAYSGLRLSYFNMRGKQYQVIGQADRVNRDDPDDLKLLFVKNRAGQLISLDNVISIEEVSAPPQLYHYNRYKSATVSAGLAPGKTMGDGVEAMQRIADEVLDDTFATSLSGPSRDFAESSSNTFFAFALALVLVYLVLAAQFESFIDPVIIMITVPLAIAGALLSLWIFGQTINIFSQIGIIMLIGLVTKNGILIVEFANKIKESGAKKSEAVVEAASMRLRPILMTTLATMLGALPIALSLGAASQSRMPLGIVIVGGLLFSLLLTLFVIPAMYALISRNIKTKKP